MIRNKNILNPAKKLNLSLLLLFICLWGPSFSAWSQQSGIEYKKDKTCHFTDVIKENVQVTTEAYTSRYTSNLLHLPVESILNFSESNEIDEKENADDDKGEYGFVPSNWIEDLKYKSTDISIAQMEQNVLKRTKTSLVVLHHSWKSFLI